MSGHTKIGLKNSLREHHKPNFINTIRKLINVRKGSSVGSDVIIDKNVEILINNAGFGLFGMFNDTDWEIERNMIMVPVFLIKIKQ